LVDILMKKRKEVIVTQDKGKMAPYNIYDGRHALRILLIVTISVVAVVVSGCNEAVKDETPPMPKQTVVPPAPVINSTPQLPNPASKYCIDQGYNITIRTNPDGSQTGYCIFPDGRECEEWAYFRGECKNE
jgi:putative hemolysin